MRGKHQPEQDSVSARATWLRSSQRLAAETELKCNRGPSSVAWHVTYQMNLNRYRVQESVDEMRMI